MAYLLSKIIKEVRRAEKIYFSIDFSDEMNIISIPDLKKPLKTAYWLKGVMMKSIGYLGIVLGALGLTILMLILMGKFT